MEQKNKINEFILETAHDCIQNMNENVKQFFIDHVNTVDYHFGYALYIRNYYIYPKEELKDLEADSLSNAIIIKILEILIPEYNYKDRFIHFLYSDKQFVQMRNFYRIKYHKEPVKFLKLKQSEHLKLIELKAEINKIKYNIKSEIEHSVKKTVLKSHKLLDELDILFLFLGRTRPNLKNKELYKELSTDTQKTVQLLVNLAYKKNLEYENTFAFYINRSKSKLRNLLLEEEQQVKELLKKYKISLVSFTAFQKYTIKLYNNYNIFIPLHIILLRYKNQIPAELYKEIRKEWCSILKTDIDIVKYINPIYITDKIIAKTILNQDVTLLKYIKQFQNNYEIVLYAVKKSGKAIKFASSSLKKNRSILKAAMKGSKYSPALQETCMKPYRDDDELVKLAILANGSNIIYASKRIRDDEQMAVLALTHLVETYFSSEVFKVLSKRLRNCISLAKIELSHPYPNIDLLSEQLKDNDELAAYVYKHKSQRHLLEDFSQRIQEKYGLNKI